ncbi:TetR family transcriptional regulator [Streptomyces gardneri]|uniref:acyl-CoA-like ligand-binding transcription factor n=1 Tax=Streptomyces gardneri TaxID=66892 RepID=UPI0033FB02F2
MFLAHPGREGAYGFEVGEVEPPHVEQVRSHAARREALGDLVALGAVTVDEIATTAGVSKRTFFRYFASKEDVVVQFLADMGADMRAELAARPAGERPSEALLHAVSVPLSLCGDHAERALPVVRLILRTPALLARFLEHEARWREELTEELGARLGLDPEAELYPRLAAGMAVAAFDTVLHHWSGDGEEAEDPTVLIGRAFAVLAPALDRETR